MIKRTLYNAPEKAKFLAYTSLCRPILEYAATVWDPQQKNLVHDIEMVQNSAVRFICNLKGRESVSEATENLNLTSNQP